MNTDLEPLGDVTDAGIVRPVRAVRLRRAPLVLEVRWRGAPVSSFYSPTPCTDITETTLPF